MQILTRAIRAFRKLRSADANLVVFETAGTGLVLGDWFAGVEDATGADEGLGGLTFLGVFEAVGGVAGEVGYRVHVCGEGLDLERWGGLGDHLSGVFGVFPLWLQLQCMLHLGLCVRRWRWQWG